MAERRLPRPCPMPSRCQRAARHCRRRHAAGELSLPASCRCHRGHCTATALPAAVLPPMMPRCQAGCRRRAAAATAAAALSPPPRYCRRPAAALPSPSPCCRAATTTTTAMLPPPSSRRRCRAAAATATATAAAAHFSSDSPTFPLLAWRTRRPRAKKWDALWLKTQHFCGVSKGNTTSDGNESQTALQLTMQIVALRSP